MKRKLLVSVFVLAMAASSFGAGEILVANFEEDGMDYGWGGGTTAIVTGTGNTLDDNALEVKSQGGWGGTVEFYLGGTEAQTALGSTGQVIMDITTFSADFPAGWAEVALLVNAEGMWNAFDYQGVVLNSTQTITFQLPAEAMAIFAGTPSYANIGLLSNTSGMETDPVTGNPLYDAMAVYYVDNVRVVPEPATLALLGIGALSLIRRKR